MSAEEYITGIGSDEWLSDPCDFMPDSCYEGGAAPSAKAWRSKSLYGNPVASFDMKEAEAKVPAQFKTVALPDETKIIKRTQKAVLFLLPNQQKLWVPNYGITQWELPFSILDKFWIAPDSDKAEFANPVHFKQSQPCCPYCGERNCNCGTPVK